MISAVDPKVSIVVPNWNGADSLGLCLDSLLKQTITAEIIVVENGSTDESLDILKTKFPGVILVINKKNLGFAGGVNSGIKKAIDLGSDYVALFNNDAVTDKDWLKKLVAVIESDTNIGIVTCKFLDEGGKKIDSTGDIYTTWGLPYPRGRNEKVDTAHYEGGFVFGATGGASLYRVRMLKSIGYFDNDFFAYYEDVDLSFRAQLTGWKVKYVPESVAYHQIGATSRKIKGFTTYQTMKNLPILLWKNVPLKLMPKILPRFALSYLGFFISSFQRNQGFYATKGFIKMLLLLPKKSFARARIQKSRTVSIQYIQSIITNDLPPNATKLRLLRDKWRKLLQRGAK